MAAAETHSLQDLYEKDETAWLESMAEMIRLNGRIGGCADGNPLLRGP